MINSAGLNCFINKRRQIDTLLLHPVFVLNRMLMKTFPNVYSSLTDNVFFGGKNNPFDTNAVDSLIAYCVLLFVWIN